MKKYICFITKRPNKYLVQLALEITELTDFQPIIVVDDNKFDDYIINQSLIKLDDAEVIKRGYALSNYQHVKKNPSGWDKALFYCCEVLKDVEHVWFIEDDVFIPSIQALVDLDLKSGEADLVCEKKDFYLDEIYWPHWEQARGLLPEPWVKSLACMVRLSNNMLIAVKNYAAKNIRLVFIELLFTSLAVHNEMLVYNPKELSTITWTWKKGFWTFKDISTHPNNFFHPVKQFDNHGLFRKKLKEQEKSTINGKKIPQLLAFSWGSRF
jgi:hypothetical protein